MRRIKARSILKKYGVRLKKRLGQNFLLDPAVGTPKELHDDELFQSLPVSVSIFRIYSKDHAHDGPLNAALNRVFGDVEDSKTNM